MVSKVEGIMMCSAGPSQETPLVEGSWGVDHRTRPHLKEEACVAAFSWVALSLDSTRRSPGPAPSGVDPADRSGDW